MELGFGPAPKAHTGSQTQMLIGPLATQILASDRHKRIFFNVCTRGDQKNLVHLVPHLTQVLDLLYGVSCNAGPARGHWRRARCAGPAPPGSPGSARTSDAGSPGCSWGQRSKGALSTPDPPALSTPHGARGRARASPTSLLSGAWCQAVGSPTAPGRQAGVEVPLLQRDGRHSARLSADVGGSGATSLSLPLYVFLPSLKPSS